MGGLCTKLLLCPLDRRMQILMVGLDGTGMTTILEKTNPGKVSANHFAAGLRTETVQNRKFNITAFCIAYYPAKTRQLFRFYFHNVQGLIFVVDSTDKERIDEVASQLEWLLSEEELRDAALLIFANKQDMPNAQSAADLTQRLNLIIPLKQRLWHIQPCRATRKEGVQEGFQWLSSQIKNKSRKTDHS